MIINKKKLKKQAVVKSIHPSLRSESKLEEKYLENLPVNTFTFL